MSVDTLMHVTAAGWCVNLKLEIVFGFSFILDTKIVYKFMS